MANTRIVASAFEVIEAASSTGKLWLKLAPVDASGETHTDQAAYLVPADRLPEVKALRASLKGMYDVLTAHIEKLEAATPAPAPTRAAPVQDTRVDALSAKVDALTEAMTALAQLVAKNAAPAPAPAPANGKAKAPAPAPASANPLADLPF